MTRKFWAKSPRVSIDGYASATPRSTRSSKSNRSTPISTPLRGIRLVLGCRNKADVRNDDVDPEELANSGTKKSEILNLPIEYPHSDLSLTYTDRSESDKKLEHPVVDQDSTIEARVLMCIKSLNDCINSAIPEGWSSSEILARTIEKVNEITPSVTSCFPTKLVDDSRTVHSDSKIVLLSQEKVVASNGIARARSWPIASSNAYVTAAVKQDEILRHVICSLKNEIDKMKRKELELIQASNEVEGKYQRTELEMERQLKTHQDEMQRIEAERQSECEQIIALKAEVARLAECTMKIQNKIQQEKEVNPRDEKCLISGRENNLPTESDDSNECVEHDHVTFNATSTPQLEVRNCDETSSAPSIDTSRVNHKSCNWFGKNSHEQLDEKSQITQSVIFEWAKPTGWCVGTNHDSVTMDESLVSTCDDTQDERSSSNFLSRLFSKKEQLQKKASAGSDTSSTQSSESEAIKFLDISVSVTSIDKTSTDTFTIDNTSSEASSVDKASDVSSSDKSSIRSDKELTKVEKNANPLTLFAGKRRNMSFRKRVQSVQGRILVQ